MDGMRAYRGGTLVLSLLTVVLGLAMIAVTLAQGGGGIGILLGLLFLAAGAGRLYLLRGGRP